MAQNKDFIGTNHGTGPIKLKELSPFEKEIGLLVMKPTEIHLKEDGSIKDEPSLAIVMQRPDIGATVVGEISLEMFNEGLADIGYKMVKI